MRVISSLLVATLILIIVVFVCISCSFDRLNLQIDKGELDPGGKSGTTFSGNTNSGIQIPVDLNIIP